MSYFIGSATKKISLAIYARSHKGYRPEDIAHAIFGSWGWHGNESDLWSKWIERFDNLLQHTDPRIQQIAQVGKEIVTERRERALQRERNEAVFGYRN